MVKLLINFKIIKRLSYLVCFIFILFSISSCDLQQNKETATPVKSNLPLVKIGRLICGGHLPLAIVEKKYQHELTTFKLQTIQNHDWNDVILDIKSGKLAGTFILSPLAMNLIHEGFAGKIVLMADRNGNGFVLSKKIKSIEELNNKKSIIAVPHMYSQHNVLLHTLLQKHNISKDKIIVVAMPPRDMINSLKKGEIDGFIVGEPEGNKAISIGIGWMAAISPTIWEDHMDHVFLASDTFIKNEPAKLQELINKLVKGGDFIEKNPHEAAIMGEDYTGSFAATFEQVLTTPNNWITYTNMVASKDDIYSMAIKLVEMKLWQKIPKDIESYFNMEFAIKAEQKIRNLN